MTRSPCLRLLVAALPRQALSQQIFSPAFLSFSSRAGGGGAGAFASDNRLYYERAQEACQAAFCLARTLDPDFIIWII
jgi:hypothetical protein